MKILRNYFPSKYVDTLLQKLEKIRSEDIKNLLLPENSNEKGVRSYLLLCSPVIEKYLLLFLKGSKWDLQGNAPKVDLSSSFPDLPKFKEFILRRHAIVHAGGNVTSEYLRRARSINGIDVRNLKKGQRLPVDSQYVIKKLRR